MISKTAQADIEDMWEAGLKPTFEDIVRLNALALTVERTRAGFALNVLPRAAFLGDVTFREPTIGSDIWLDKAAALFAADKADTYMLLRAFSLSMPQSDLPDPYDEKAVLEGVGRMRDRLAFATFPQVMAAVGYAVHGFDPESGEVPERPAADGAKETARPADETSCDIGLLYEGMSLRIGSMEELKTLPRRALREMAIRAIRMQTERDVRKSVASDAEDDYLRTLDAITERLERERANSEIVVEKVLDGDEGIRAGDVAVEHGAADQREQDEHGDTDAPEQATAGSC